MMRGRRVERNPTDLQFRFELGEHLMNAGHFREALAGVAARPTESKCSFEGDESRSGDVIASWGCLIWRPSNWRKPRSEIATMDAIKKEIVYNLGLVYERMGDREKSLACMKQIYEADYGYKDVATRVESSYAAGS